MHAYILDCRHFLFHSQNVIGVWLHESGVLGASPDGIIHRAATYNYSHQDPEVAELLEAMGLQPEIMEVKCPFSARNLTIQAAITSCKGFCLGNLKILKDLKPVDV